MRTMIDSERGKHGQDDILHQVWHVNTADGQQTVRVQVHSNFYAAQSWAKAQVLTPGLEWTDLAVALSGNWHQQGTPLEAVAAGLLDRAERILSLTRRGGTRNDHRRNDPRTGIRP